MNTAKMKILSAAMAVTLSLTFVTASTVIPPTFEQLVQQAELIFQGTVTDVRSVWEGEGAQRHIDTYVTFQIDDNVKGNTTSSYTIRMLGGTVGDETMEVTDSPKFTVGDREVLFVEHNNDQFVPLVGINHGHFRVQREEQTGHDIIMTGEGEAVRDLAQLGHNEEAATTNDAAEAVSLDDLKSAVQRELGDRADQTGHPEK
jgi:hypothetical protein